MTEVYAVSYRNLWSPLATPGTVGVRRTPDDAQVLAAAFVKEHAQVLVGGSAEPTIDLWRGTGSDAWGQVMSTAVYVTVDGYRDDLGVLEIRAFDLDEEG